MKKNESDDMFSQYSYYSSILRNWFIVFGVGGLVFLVNQKALLENLGSAKSTVISFFMWGVIIQIGLALLNKVIHWFTYWGEEIKEANSKLKLPGHIYNFFYIWSDKVCSWFWLDMFADITTLVLFYKATSLLLNNA